MGGTVSLLDQPGFDSRLDGLDRELPRALDTGDEPRDTFHPLVPETSADDRAVAPSVATTARRPLPSAGFLAACVTAGVMLAAVVFHAELLSLVR